MFTIYIYIYSLIYIFKQVSKNFQVFLAQHVSRMGCIIYSYSKRQFSKAVIRCTLHKSTFPLRIQLCCFGNCQGLQLSVLKSVTLAVLEQSGKGKQNKLQKFF